MRRPADSHFLRPSSSAFVPAWFWVCFCRRGSPSCCRCARFSPVIFMHWVVVAQVFQRSLTARLGIVAFSHSRVLFPPLAYGCPLRSAFVLGLGPRGPGFGAPSFPPPYCDLLPWFGIFASKASGRRHLPALQLSRRASPPTPVPGCAAVLWTPPYVGVFPLWQWLCSLAGFPSSRLHARARRVRCAFLFLSILRALSTRRLGIVTAAVCFSPLPCALPASVVALEPPSTVIGRAFALLLAYSIFRCAIRAHRLPFLPFALVGGSSPSNLRARCSSFRTCSSHTQHSFPLLLTRHLALAFLHHWPFSSAAVTPR